VGFLPWLRVLHDGRVAVLAVLIWQLSSLARAEPRRALPLIVTMVVCTILLDILDFDTLIWPTSML
jgi:hypothetical protein